MVDAQHGWFLYNNEIKKCWEEVNRLYKYNSRKYYLNENSILLNLSSISSILTWILTTGRSIVKENSFFNFPLTKKIISILWFPDICNKLTNVILILYESANIVTVFNRCTQDYSFNFGNYYYSCILGKKF